MKKAGRKRELKALNRRRERVRVSGRERRRRMATIVKVAFAGVVELGRPLSDLSIPSIPFHPPKPFSISAEAESRPRETETETERQKKKKEGKVMHAAKADDSIAASLLLLLLLLLLPRHTASRPS